MFPLSFDRINTRKFWVGISRSYPTVLNRNPITVILTKKNLLEKRWTHLLNFAAFSSASCSLSDQWIEFQWRKKLGAKFCGSKTGNRIEESQEIWWKFPGNCRNERKREGKISWKFFFIWILKSFYTILDLLLGGWSSITLPAAKNRFTFLSIASTLNHFQVLHAAWITLDTVCGLFVGVCVLWLWSSQYEP